MKEKPCPACQEPMCWMPNYPHDGERGAWECENAHAFDSDGNEVQYERASKERAT